MASWLKQRWELLSTSVVVPLLFRPSDWPVPPGGWDERIRGKTNLLLFLVLSISGALLLDGLLEWRRRRSSKASPSPALSVCRHPYWIGSFSAILIGLTVNLVWPDRLLSPDRLGIVPLEIQVGCFGLFVLAILPVALPWRKRGQLRARQLV